MFFAKFVSNDFGYKNHLPYKQNRLRTINFYVARTAQTVSKSALTSLTGGLGKWTIGSKLFIS